MAEWTLTRGIDLENWRGFHIKRLPISQEEIDLCVPKGWPLTEIWLLKFGPFEFEFTRVLHTANTQTAKEIFNG